MEEQNKILIVEDETIIAARIALELVELGYEILGIVTRGEQALQYCEEALPDLLLLDINLKGKIDGVELAAQLLGKGHKIPVIFLTANADEATFNRAKKVHPYAFISKPYKKMDLQRAVELTIRQAYTDQTDQVAVPREKAGSVILEDRIFVRHQQRLVKLMFKDVLFVEADRSYCKLQTAEQQYLLSIPLNALAEQLPADQFIRTHRSCIINLQQVDELQEDAEYVTIRSFQLPVSRRLRKQVLRHFRRT